MSCLLSSLGKLDTLKQRETKCKQQQVFLDSVNKVIPGKCKGSLIIDLLDDDNNEVNAPDTAEHIKTFYRNIGPLLASAHTAEWVFAGTECIRQYG